MIMHIYITSCYAYIASMQNICSSFQHFIIIYGLAFLPLSLTQSVQHCLQYTCADLHDPLSFLQESVAHILLPTVLQIFHPENNSLHLEGSCPLKKSQITLKRTVIDYGYEPRSSELVSQIQVYKTRNCNII